MRLLASQEEVCSIDFSNWNALRRLITPRLRGQSGSKQEGGGGTQIMTTLRHKLVRIAFPLTAMGSLLLNQGFTPTHCGEPGISPTWKRKLLDKLLISHLVTHRPISRQRVAKQACNNTKPSVVRQRSGKPTSYCCKFCFLCAPPRGYITNTSAVSSVGGVVWS
jgi:hypothetical protein